MSVFRQKLILFYLFLSILFINYWSYSSAYFSDPNSLKYNYVFLALLVPLFLFDISKFILFIFKNQYARILSVFFVFFVTDLLLNYPLNKYKIDTVILLIIILIFSFLFKNINHKVLTNFIYINLLVWMIFSFVELYIINNYPLLHLNTWEGIGIQTIFPQGYQYHGFGIHGLGITSQVNTSALIILVVFSIYYIRIKTNIFFKVFNFTVIFFCVYLLQFSSSLTGVLSLLIAIYFYLLCTKTIFSIRYSYFSLFTIAFIFSSAIFIIGNLIGFSARTGNEEAYYYDLIQWPIEYYINNFITISLGFQNYIPADITPLENRYFNLLLSVGLFFTVFVLSSFYSLHKSFFLMLKYFKNSKHSTFYGLILIIFTYLIFSYFHISYLPHTNGLIFFALIFVFCSSTAFKKILFE